MIEQTIILILCKDSDFLRGYICTAAAVIGGANVVAASQLGELCERIDNACAQTVPVGLCLLDLSAVPQQSTLDGMPALETVIKNSEQTLLLNSHKHGAFVDRVRDICKSCVVTQKYIPETSLRQMLDKMVIRTIVPEGREVRREKAPCWAPQGAAPIELDEAANRILEQVCGRFTHEQDLLLTRFETTTSRVILPETLSASMPKLHDIQEAVEELRTFMSSVSGRHNGKLIVGEKGVGKTTLCHYVAALMTIRDPYFLFLPIDYQWVPFFEITSRFEAMVQAFLDITTDEAEISESIFESLRLRINEGKVDDLRKPSVAIRNVLSAMKRDGGLIVSMYCHFNDINAFRKYVDKYDIDRMALEDEATEWIEDRCKDPRMLLLHYLVFGVERQGIGFEQFSWERIIASLVECAKKRKQIRDLISGYLHCNLDEMLEQDKATPKTVLSMLGQKGVDASAFVTDILHTLSEKGYRPIIFVDNIDAKYSQIVELLLLRNSQAFLQRISSIASFDAVICVRNSTYASHDFKKLDIEGVMMWSSLQIRPPDLVAVLKRRIDCLRETGEWIGRGGWFLTDFLYRWVTHMIKGKWPRTILDIIEKRYPFNVRDQLNLFAVAARSTILHHRRISLAKVQQYTSWGDISPEFCLRALAWGKESFYAESRQNFVPNIFDNGYPNCPFNAFIRVLCLTWMFMKHDFALKELIDTMVDAGIPKQAVEDAIDTLKGFNLVRQSYEKAAGQWTITSWGKYFYSNVYFSLAYIQTVWWDTRLLEGFSLGTARILEWQELREPARAFYEWLRVEEALVRRHLKVPLENLAKESIWEKISTELAHDLNKIERSLPSYLQREQRKR